MSQYYMLGRQDLWNPATGVSTLFRRQLEVFEADLGLPSGIGPMESDESQVDPVALAAFAGKLVADLGGYQHPVRRVMVEGFAAVVVVLAQRAGIALDLTGAPALRDAAREMATSMVQ
jgi:hypothetical protein